MSTIGIGILIYAGLSVVATALICLFFKGAGK